MPYIPKWRREDLEPLLDSLISELKRVDFPDGDINYVFSRIINEAFKANTSYNTINKIMGVCNCVAMEFYARKARPYEDKKIEINGDII